MTPLQLDWKTTAIGILGAIFYGTSQMLQVGNISFEGFANMAFMAAIGYFAKDRK